jgi:hypothetical protein
VEDVASETIGITRPLLAGEHLRRGQVTLQSSGHDPGGRMPALLPADRGADGRHERLERGGVAGLAR